MVDPVVPARRHLVFHQLPVAAVERLTEDSVVVSFEVPVELREDYSFSAGQHLTLRVRLDGQEVRRSYSLCVAEGSSRLKIAVKQLPGGLFSGHANNALMPGDLVEVLTPAGRFTTEFSTGRARNYCAVAAGSGITPVLSLIGTALAVEPGSHFSLVYGNRTSRSVMFLDELADLKDRYPDRLQLVHIFSQETTGAELFNGRLDPARLSRILDLVVDASTVDEWFLCGPHELVSCARKVLVARGAEADSIRTELFHVDEGIPARSANVGKTVAGGGPGQGGHGTSDSSGCCEVTILLDGRASRISMPRGAGSVLDAALGVRSELPFACKGGVCSTCRAKVISGEVAMARNYALDPAEVEQGYVLTCQSRPLTAELTLDYDA
jgi:ring-1,2-phenylacetyl-CoA epoxidase subunit PaaE